MDAFRFSSRDLVKFFFLWISAFGHHLGYHFQTLTIVGLLIAVYTLYFGVEPPKKEEKQDEKKPKEKQD